MKNRLYCLGGSQDGVKVCLTGDHFFSPNDELYKRCTLRIQSKYRYAIAQPFWKLNSMTHEAAERQANMYKPDRSGDNYVD